MNLPTTIETVVVGAGHAGLTMSWFLTQANREHLVLERRSGLGGGWQDRWDAFQLVSPNWTASFPGFPYDGPDPDAFMPRDHIAERVARYADVIAAPVALETDVRQLTARAGGGFRLETSRGDIDAKQVVVAIGGFHVPHIPAVAAELPGRITRLHSHAYRNEGLLPPGGVLIVGSGQSGVQIAEELADAGRRVFLSVGSAARVPRRYRGQDIFKWLAALVTRGEAIGSGLPTVDKLPDPRFRLAGNAQLSGHHGGHDANPRRLASKGMTLLGRIERIDGERLHLTRDLRANLARADGFFDERLRPIIDTYIERAGVDAPPDDDRQPVNFEPPEPATLDLEDADIATVIFATGYRPDYSWIDPPIVDELGFPRQRRGVTDVPGLYFLGSLWQHTQASATLFGPTVDGRYLAEQMGLPVRDGVPEPA
jgi:putative flavoprotein involved in K+ transport